MCRDKWIVICERYERLEAQAVNRVASAVAEYSGYALPVFTVNNVDIELLEENNLIVIGQKTHLILSRWIKNGLLQVKEGEQGYSIKVCDSLFNPDRQAVAICGNDEVGVLYGAVDFINFYMGEGMHLHEKYLVATEKFFASPFREQMPKFTLCSTPSIRNRGIWTWGHCIYDYRRFFDNMVTLKLNHVVIWNDFVPVNGKDIVNYAHSLGIKVFWGFTWGWFNLNERDFKIDDEGVINTWAERVRTTYFSQYHDLEGDGIYFQSFTETTEEYLDGVCIAEAVVKWVNTISARILAEAPCLSILFGLHATSVKDHLKYIEQVDSRVEIIWEDCGSFPYDYRPHKVKNYEQTRDFQQKVCNLRGNDEQFGCVLKGMLTLDWYRFEYQSGSYVLGESSPDFIAKKANGRERLWKYLQAYWLENADYAVGMLDQIKQLTQGNARVQMLVEDGFFEEKIYFPAALCAQLMWDTQENGSTVIREVALFPQVKFAS